MQKCCRIFIYSCQQCRVRNFQKDYGSDHDVVPIFICQRTNNTILYRDKSTLESLATQNKVCVLQIIEAAKHTS